MKSYAESKGKTPFDWNEFLGRERNEDEWCMARLAAKHWVTCACGSQCEIIPRTPIGCPVDYQLDELGRLFFVAVNGRNQIKAKSILSLIESRSSELIREIQSKK